MTRAQLAQRISNTCGRILALEGLIPKDVINLIEIIYYTNDELPIKEMEIT